MPALDPLKNISSNEVLYQRRCANYVYVAPSGLRELMADMTREVTNIRKYVILYFRIVKKKMLSFYRSYGFALKTYVVS